MNFKFTQGSGHDLAMKNTAVARQPMRKTSRHYPNVPTIGDVCQFKKNVSHQLETGTELYLQDYYSVIHVCGVRPYLELFCQSGCHKISVERCE